MSSRRLATTSGDAQGKAAAPPLRVSEGGVPASAVVALWVWQWVATMTALLLIAGVARVPWGAWLPAGIYALATALWGWSEGGQRWLRTRAHVKALASRAGGLGASVCAIGWTLGVALLPQDLGVPLGKALGVGVLGWGVGGLVLTGLTLIGLDAARSPTGSGAMEASRRGARSVRRFRTDVSGA